MSCDKSNFNPNVPCEELDGQLLKWFLIKDGVTFVDQDAAKVKANMDALIQSGDVIPLPKAHSLEDQSTGAAYDDSATSRITVSNGMISYMLMIKANSEMYRRIESLTGQTSYGIFAASETGKYKMHLNDDGTLGGFALQNINVENHTINDGSVAEKAPFNFTFEDINEWRKESNVFTPSYNPNRVRALSDVTLVIGATVNATTIEVNVYEMANNSDVMLANPVLGFVEEDFQLLDASGAAQTISGFGGGIVGTETYTLTGTAFVSGTLTLKIPELMTTQGYKAQNTLTITIP